MATAASRVLVAVQVLVAACAVLGGGGCFTRLFSFGDSITDNGNWMRYARSPGAVARPPYGETFFRRPNGRFCDGRIIIDHIGVARALAVLSSFFLAGGHTWLASYALIYSHCCALSVYILQLTRWGYRS
jgi:hypothetical protein